MAKNEKNKPTLTVVLGPQNSGKSYLATALLHKQGTPATTLLDYPHTTLKNITQHLDTEQRSVIAVFQEFPVPAIMERADYAIQCSRPDAPYHLGSPGTITKDCGCFAVYHGDAVVQDLNCAKHKAASASADDEQIPGGSTPSQYALPATAREVQDLIEHREMNFALGNIFKAAYRLGHCAHSTALRDLNKIKWFAEREIARRTPTP